MNRMLLLVDPQIDFITGTLPVPGAEEAMNNLADWLQDKDYAFKIITMDFHPWPHCSFKENGGQWPRHCVNHSAGAAIWPALLKSLFRDERNIFLHKGVDKDRDEYSVFNNPVGKKRIIEAINENEIKKIDICGVAGDVCVLNTLRDGVDCLGAGMFNVLEVFSPSLDGGNALKQFCGRL